MELLDLKIKLEEQRALHTAKHTETRDALEADNLEDAKTFREELDAIKSEIDALVAKVAELEEATKEEGKEEQEEQKTQTEKEDDKMKDEIRNITGGEVSEQRKAFENFIETRAIDGDNLKTDSGFVVVPEEIVNEIHKIQVAEFNLDKYVNVKKVSNGAGKYPVIRGGYLDGLPTVEELQENPKLAVSPYFELRYDIVTRRGFFKVSQELIEDAAVDVTKELSEYIGRLVAATRNKAIIDVIDKGTAGEGGANVKFANVAAKNLDDIKDALNLKVSPNYANKVVLMNQSSYNELDKLKDGTGNYLLQNSIVAPSGKQLFGAPIEVISDQLLKSKSGAHPIIVGDLKSGITLFERSEYQAKWEDYMHFGHGVMVAVRFDTKIADKEAAIVINFKPEVVAPVVPEA